MMKKILFSTMLCLGVLAPVWSAQAEENNIFLTVPYHVSHLHEEIQRVRVTCQVSHQGLSRGTGYGDPISVNRGQARGEASIEIPLGDYLSSINSSIYDIRNELNYSCSMAASTSSQGSSGRNFRNRMQPNAQNVMYRTFNEAVVEGNIGE